MDLPVAANAREIGECIYCGQTEGKLTKEHAVPYSLNGRWTLLRASCEKHARITGAIERETARCLYPSVRNVLRMQSRKGNYPESLPVIIRRSGEPEPETIHVPRNEFPLYLPTPLFPPPAVLWRKEPKDHFYATLEVLHIAGPTFKQFSEQRGVAYAGEHINFDPVAFARTLAKIGFCAAIYTLGLAPLSLTPIRNIILGTDLCIGHWVGCWYGEPVNEMGGGIEIRVKASGHDIHVFIRLFAQFEAPEYHVVLGPASPDFIASGQWPFKS